MINLYNQKYIIWARLFISFVFVFLFSVAVVNWVVDVSWCFQHEVPSSAHWQEFYNERQQKTNLIAFRKPQISTLIMGTSHMMYANPEIWGSDSFNYGVSRLMPIEYKYIVRNAKLV